MRIKPTNDQKQILNHWIGCASFTYNQGLSIVKDYTSKEDRPSIHDTLIRRKGITLDTQRPEIDQGLRRSQGAL